MRRIRVPPHAESSASRRVASRRAPLLRTRPEGGFSAGGSRRRPPSTPSQRLLDPSPPSPPHAHRRAFAQFGDAVIHVASCSLSSSGGSAGLFTPAPPLPPRGCASGRLRAQARQEWPSEPGRAAGTWRRRGSAAALLPPCGSR